MDSVESEGVWWRPEDESRTSVGILHFTPFERARLDLIGSLLGEDVVVNLPADPSGLTDAGMAGLAALIDETDAESATPGDAERSREPFPLRVPTVHGVIGRHLVTLHDLTELRRDEFSVPGFPRQSFDVGRVLTGAHVHDENSATYETASFSFDGLAEWCGGALDSGPSGVESSTRMRVLRMPQTRHFELNSGEVIELGYRSRQSRSANEYSEWREPEFHARFPDRKTLPEVFSTTIRPLQDLITAASGRPAALSRLVVTTPDASWNGHPLSIEVGVASSRPVPAPTQFHASQMLLPLSELDLETTLPRWFTIHRQHEAATQFSFGTRYAEAAYQEHRLLGVTAAVEALHESQTRPPRTSFTDNETAVAAVLAAVPPEEHERILVRLAHLNDPSLNTQVADLLIMIGPAMGDLAPRPGRWRRAVVDARNGVAHGAADRPTGAQLRALAEAVTHLIEMCLFVEAGLPPEHLAARLASSARYAWLVSLREEYVDGLLTRR